MVESSKTFLNSKEEIEKILRKETMGFLGMCMDNIPYVIPLTYVYDNGKILFHCALQGLKLDYIRSNPRVCFTTGRQSGKIMRHPCQSSCRESQDSAVCFGTARIIENIDKRLKVLNIFNQVLQPGAKSVIKKEASKCYAVVISIARMTGRIQRKGLNRSYFEYTFN